MKADFENLGTIAGAYKLKFKLFSDERGSFSELYRRSEGKKFDTNFSAEQISISKNNRNVLRGLHYQVRYAQGQILSIISGSVFDVLVDLRPNSPTFKNVFHITISQGDEISIYMPPGVAHGFYALEDSTHLLYINSKEYMPTAERGIIWNDPTLNIPWPVREPITSERDSAFPKLDDLPINELPQRHQ